MAGPEHGDGARAKLGAPAAAGGKRRLPVLQNHAEDEVEDRPAWHWVLIGAAATFVVWLPLAFLATALVRGLLGGGTGAPGAAPAGALVGLVGLHALALALGALAAGLLVGRFGGRAGPREATQGGLAAAALAWAYLAAAGARPSPLELALQLVVLGLLAGGPGHLGGRLGVRLRHRA